MTKKEAVQILAILKAAYPASYNGMTKEEANGTVSVWCLQFSNMPVDIVMMAIQKLISTNKFPPTVAEVKQKIQAIHWEAYEMISSSSFEGLLSDKAKEKYQRIYDATKDYRVQLGEPYIAQMMSGNQLLLGGE